MKYKLKIMKTKPEVSDEEILKLMDFDRLMDKHEKIVADKNKINQWRKISIISLSLLAVSIAWLSHIENQRSLSSQSSPETQPPAEQHTIPSTQGEKIDTPVADKMDVNETPTQVSPKKNISAEKATAVEENIATEADPKTHEIAPVPSGQYVEASPLDGYPALYEYFSRELVYPEEGLRDSIQGIVTVSFVINQEGRPEKISIEKSLGEAFDRETIKVINNMPPWKPAHLNNRPVPSKLSLPMTFQIQKIKAKE
jgi:protein TonB